MSKAFTKEDESDAPPLIAHRAPLPEGVPNYVTVNGLAALRQEHDELLAERARLELSDDSARAELTVLNVRLRDLDARLASAVLVDTAQQPKDEVRFGATVRVRSESGAERTYSIVGVDEASVRDGRIAFTAPLARALLGKRSGESAIVRTPHGEEELELISVGYDT